MAAANQFLKDCYNTADVVSALMAPVSVQCDKVVKWCYDESCKTLRDTVNLTRSSSEDSAVADGRSSFARLWDKSSVLLDDDTLSTPVDDDGVKYTAQSEESEVVDTAVIIEKSTEVVYVIADNVGEAAKAKTIESSKEPDAEKGAEEASRDPRHHLHPIQPRKLVRPTHLRQPLRRSRKTSNMIEAPSTVVETVDASTTFLPKMRRMALRREKAKLPERQWHWSLKKLSS